MNIKELLAKKPDEEFIDDSGWMDGVGQNKSEEAHIKMKNRYLFELDKFVAVLGQPNFNERSTKQLAAEIHFEAINLPGWKLDNGFIYLACGQYDTETSVFVSWGYKEI